MKNKPSTNSNFEKLMQEKLRQVDERPDAGTWAQLAARQAPKNHRLRFRYYARYAVPALALLVLASIGWWQYQRPAPVLSAPGQEYPVPPARQPDVKNLPPVAGTDAYNPESNVAAIDAVPSPVVLRAEHRYGNRVNTVPASTVHFRTDTGLRFQSPVSGTIVYIPANSLIRSDGTGATGEAELVFREYRSLADFLASGIPMHYADERGSFFFNSGGMFEVRVYQDREMLSMAPGQTYDVEFEPTGQLVDASLYYLNDATESWVYQPDPAFTRMGEQTPQALPAALTESDVLRNNTKNIRAENCLPEMLEYPPLDPASTVKDGVQTGYDLAMENAVLPMWFQKHSNLNNEQLLNSMEQGLIRIVRDRDRVEQFFPEDVNNVFTEMKAFKDCYFTRAVDSTQTMQKFTSDSYWHRISVVQDKGNLCLIWLFGEKGMVQFYANLNGSAGNDDFSADKVMGEYRRLRNERQKNFETQTALLRRFLLVAPVFQTQQEWCMDPETWMAYFQGNHPLMRKRYDELVKAGLTTNDSLARATWNAWRTRLRNMHFDRYERVVTTVMKAKEGLKYALKLSSFGVYNCDQIFRLGRQPEPDYIYAGYETQDGRRIIPSSVSVMERSSRLFFTLPAADKMLRVPGRKLDVVVTDMEGRSYHLPADKYAALHLESRQSNTFTVEDVTEKTRTPREWADLLEM